MLSEHDRQDITKRYEDAVTEFDEYTEELLEAQEQATAREILYLARSEVYCANLIIKLKERYGING